MGGPGSGREPDRRKQRQVSELRAGGLTLAEIGRRLGLSRQLVHHHLKAAGLAGPYGGTVRCCACAAVITTGHHTLEHNRRPLCLACLAERPGSPFGVRLKACRLAAGLTAEKLAARSGVPQRGIRSMEGNSWRPRWEWVARLVRVLGADLVTLGLVDGPAGGKRGRAGP
jgi:transcriptional regulator with XRE-family HTH domain